MPTIIDPTASDRAAAFNLWTNAPNPMVTFMKTLDVTPLVKCSRRRQLKFNMLLTYCIGRAAQPIREFYTLPVAGQLVQYDALAVCTIVQTERSGLASCDLPLTDSLEAFNDHYLRLTREVAASGQDHDLSSTHMVIGTSAIVQTELDGAIGMNSGIFNNPFLIWGRYQKKRWRRATLPLSFQFHHTQMDGAHAGRFLANLQTAINALR